MPLVFSVYSAGVVFPRTDLASVVIELWLTCSYPCSLRVYNIYLYPQGKALFRFILPQQCRALFSISLFIVKLTSFPSGLVLNE